MRMRECAAMNINTTFFYDVMPCGLADTMASVSETLVSPPTGRQTLGSIEMLQPSYQITRNRIRKNRVSTGLICLYGAAVKE